MNNRILFFVSCDYSSLVVRHHSLGVMPILLFGETPILCLSSSWSVCVTIFYVLRHKSCWVPSKRGLFDVRSFYSGMVWRTKAPLKATFLAWSAALGKILRTILGNNMPLWSIGTVCIKRNEEFVDYFHCEVACALWNVFSVDLAVLGYA